MHMINPFYLEAKPAFNSINTIAFSESTRKLMMSPPLGYSKLAGLMVDEDYLIFRQFKLLASRDLLFLQAELAILEKEFTEICQRDRRSSEKENDLYDYDWELLSASKSRGCGGEQWDKALQIREKLRLYCSQPLSIYSA
jgi:hypothetical protein